MTDFWEHSVSNMPGLVLFAVVRKDVLKKSQETAERLGLLLGDVRVCKEAETRNNGSVCIFRCVVGCAMSGAFCSERQREHGPELKTSGHSDPVDAGKGD